MPPIPTPQVTWVDLLRLADWPGYVILGLAVVLIVAFVVQMAGRRSNRSIRAYSLLSLLPIVVGIWGAVRVVRIAIAWSYFTGINHPNLLQGISEALIPLQFGAAVTMAALFAASILAWRGFENQPSSR